MGSSLNQQIWCPTEWIGTTAGLSPWTSLLLPTDFSPLLPRQAEFWFIPTAFLHNVSLERSHTCQLCTCVTGMCMITPAGLLLCLCSMYVQLAQKIQYWQEWMESKFRLKICPFSPAPSQSRSDRWHLRRQKKRGQAGFCGLGMMRGE